MIACHCRGQECLGGGKGSQAKRGQSSSNDRGADHILRGNCNSTVYVARTFTKVLRFVPRMVRFVPVDELNTKMGIRGHSAIPDLYLYYVNPPLRRIFQF